jgi:acetate kinase
VCFLGIAIDRTRNESCKFDAEIGRADAQVRALAVQAREDLQIAAGVRDVLGCPLSRLGSRRR